MNIFVSVSVSTWHHPEESLAAEMQLFAAASSDSAL